MSPVKEQRTAHAWQAVEADAFDAKADDLDLTVQRLEEHSFLTRDLPPEQAKQITATLALIRGLRNDYRQKAEALRE